MRDTNVWPSPRSISQNQMMSSAPTVYSALSKRKERLFLLRDSEIIHDVLFNDRLKSKMPSGQLFYSGIILLLEELQGELKDHISIKTKGLIWRSINFLASLSHNYLSCPIEFGKSFNLLRWGELSRHWNHEKMVKVRNLPHRKCGKVTTHFPYSLCRYIWYTVQIMLY